MSRQFMAYWKPDQPSFRNPDSMLNHAASNQFKRCQKGDVVWIVTLLDGQLHLVGRIPVIHLVDFETACDLLNHENLWEADWHIISDPQGGAPVRKIPVHSIANQLRFVTKKEDGRIMMDGDRISGTALQTMRQLTKTSVELFESALNDAAN